MLDLLVSRGDGHIDASVLRKQIHTGHRTYSLSNQPDHVKREVTRSLHARTTSFCSYKTNLGPKINNIFNDVKATNFSMATR